MPNVTHTPPARKLIFQHKNYVLSSLWDLLKQKKQENKKKGENISKKVFNLSLNIPPKNLFKEVKKLQNDHLSTKKT